MWPFTFGPFSKTLEDNEINGLKKKLQEEDNKEEEEYNKRHKILMTEAQKKQQQDLENRRRQLAQAAQNKKVPQQARPGPQNPTIDFQGPATYKLNPVPFPNHASVIDTILDKTKVKKINLDDVDMLVSAHRENIQAREYEKAKFNTLNDEREYYKDYFPNIEQKKTLLREEVDQLKEQSRYVRENSRLDPNMIDQQINEKSMYLNERERENMAKYDEIKRLEEETRRLEQTLKLKQTMNDQSRVSEIPSQYSHISGGLPPVARVGPPSVQRNSNNLSDFLNNYNESNNGSARGEYRVSNPPPQPVQVQTGAPPAYNYDFTRQSNPSVAGYNNAAPVMRDSYQTGQQPAGGQDMYDSYNADRSQISGNSGRMKRSNKPVSVARASNNPLMRNLNFS